MGIEFSDCSIALIFNEIEIELITSKTYVW